MGRKPILNEEDRVRIAEAVAAAESASGGEIVTAVVAESDDYGFRELLFAVVVGYLSYNLMFAFSTSLEAFVGSFFWGFDPALLPFFFGFSSLVLGVLAYAAAQVPAVDRLIVPRKTMRQAVAARAAQVFFESGARNTVDRTGILLFVSILERRVELVADTGISSRIPADTWEGIVAELSAGIGSGSLVDALVTAVGECGEVLAGHVERRDDDENELSDGPYEPGGKDG